MLIAVSIHRDKVVSKEEEQQIKQQVQAFISDKCSSFDLKAINTRARDQNIRIIKQTIKSRPTT